MASMDALSESAEMMIKNINELAADEKRVRTSDLAAKTDLKPATVTEMIQRLGDLGLVDYEAYHGVHLTKQGQHVADVIEHRFNILERFLTEILGVEGNEAAEVACRMEHVLTRDVEHKLTTFLGIDPQKESESFCHKIDFEDDTKHKYLPLSNFDEGKTGTVKLIFEDNELAKILREKGIQPGNSLMLKKTDGKIYNIETDEGSFSLDRETAAKIIVQKLMASKGILYVIVSGVKDYKRASEALRLAEYQAGDGRNIALLLQGEGVEWLEEGNEDYRREIQVSLGVVSELGSPVFLCGASLNERGLTPTMGEYKFTTSSAPKRINQVIDKGWQIAVF